MANRKSCYQLFDKVLTVRHSGSTLNGKRHGFGQVSSASWVHTGWFECGEPRGFGIRHYPLHDDIDAGIWEGNTLVKLASGRISKHENSTFICLLT